MYLTNLKLRRSLSKIIQKYFLAAFAAMNSGRICIIIAVGLGGVCQNLLFLMAQILTDAITLSSN